MRNVSGNGYDTRTETYGYDPQLDYLTSASYGDGLPNATASWSYDAAGNRNDASTDNLNRATTLGGVAVTNDVLGNRLTKGGVTYGWDVAQPPDGPLGRGERVVRLPGGRDAGVQARGGRGDAVPPRRADGDGGRGDRKGRTRR